MTAAVLDEPSTARSGPRRRPWELVASSAGVAVVGDDGHVAEAQVADETARVVVDIRSWLHGLPPELGSRLVAQAFAHPAVTADRPVLVILPRGESAVLEEVQCHVSGAQVRVAGVTCLVEGRVRAAR
jgi:hypothetical protein